jgi:hypothetical protein
VDNEHVTSKVPVFSTFKPYAWLSSGVWLINKIYIRPYHNNHMKLAIILITILFLVGCTQPITETFTCPDGTEVQDETQCPQEQEPEVQPPTQVQEPEVNSEITELINKGQQQDNYKYSFVGSELSNRGKLEPVPSYDVYINNNQMKIVYDDNILLTEDTFYNEIYYNSEETIGFCPADGRCGYNGKAYILPYNDHVPEFTPLSLLSDIPSNAEKFGESTQDGRKMTIIEYNNKRMTIDSFYGLPVEVITFDGETVTHKYNFNRLTVNTVKDSDVVLDDRFERVE